MLIKKGIFSVNPGKIARGIKKILRAAQRTHTSNVPALPYLEGSQQEPSADVSSHTINIISGLFLNKLTHNLRTFAVGLSSFMKDV